MSINETNTFTEKTKMLISLVKSVLLQVLSALNAEDVYRLWLMYDQESDTRLLRNYNALFMESICLGKSPAKASAFK